MSLSTAAQYLLIVLAPCTIAVAVMCAPRWVSAIVRALPDPAAVRGPQPIGLPIEQLAADLRRLIRLHAGLTASAHLAMRAHRLWAVEAAISARAVEAAQALEVPYRDPAEQGGVDLDELRRLLHTLADAGLVLPAAVGPFSDGRL